MSLKIPFHEAEMHLGEAIEIFEKYLPEDGSSFNEELLSAGKSSLENAYIELGIAGLECGDPVAKKYHEEVSEIIETLSEINMEYSSFNIYKIIYSKDFRNQLHFENKIIKEYTHGIPLNL